MNDAVFLVTIMMVSHLHNQAAHNLADQILKSAMYNLLEILTEFNRLAYIFIFCTVLFPHQWRGDKCSLS